MKAFGYGDREVGLHFLKLVALVVGIGCAAGIVLGTWMGSSMVRIYGDYYRTYRRVHTEQTEITERIFRVETRVYDVRSGALIWSAFYEAGESDTVEKASAPLGRAILNDLVRVGLVE